ncbi:MFS transporter [Erythrobacter sp. NFXS35]|uniref:MFS transporter n=1 Tax=Erythrobacter sp. NFXS35 TaxID=2818436 RepID=UPI0032E011A9
MSSPIEIDGDIRLEGEAAPACHPRNTLFRRRLAWLFTEAANEPFAALVQRFIFAAYFANVFVGNEETGAGLWAAGLSVVGVLTFLCAPLIGAFVDATGLRKTSLVWLSVVGAGASCLLWFAEPGMPVLPFLAIFVVSALCVELTIVITNAALSSLGTDREIGFLSGLCFAVGQLVSIFSLLMVFALARADSGDIGYTSDRLAPVVAGGALVLFLLPYLLIARNTSRSRSTGTSVSRTFETLMLTAKEAVRNRSILGVLLCRSIAGDGLSLLFALASVLAGVALGWRAGELAVFGIIVTVAACVGGLLGGVLDRSFGSLRVIRFGLALVGIATVGIIGASPDRAFFVPVPRGEIAFGYSAAELGFLLAGIIAALGAGPCFGGMRALLARLVPEGREAAYFGIFSLAGRATAFLGPMSYGAALLVLGDQQLALFVVLPFLAAGYGALWLVKHEQRAH